MKRMRFDRKWRPILLAAPVAVIFAGAYAFLRTPSWYEIPQIAAEERQSVRNNLVGAEQAFTEGLRAASGPFVFHLFQDDVNRWIAMRREIYPLIDELAPPALIDPVVLFDSDGVTIAGRYQKGGLNVVLSMDIDVRFEQEMIVLKAARLRCGSVSVPLSFATLGLEKYVDRPADSVWPGSPRMWGDFATGFHVESRGWWKNGGFDYRVTGVAMEVGKLNMTVEPLGHQRPRGRKSHEASSQP